MKKEETSEFGKGFIYNLVLFAKHFERFRSSIERTKKMAETNPELWQKDADYIWFNGAGDHLFELEIPKQFVGTEIGKLVKELRDEAIERRLSTTSQEEFDNFFVRFEKLCRMIDEALGIESIKADYN